MRHNLLDTVRITAIAATALLVAGCGGDSDEAANESDSNRLDANLMLDAPMNDASALESALNAAEPPEVAENGSQGTDSADPLGNSSGGDTGGNTVESNASGM